MGDGDESASGGGLSSELARSRQAAMSSAVLREVKSKLDSAVIRLEAVQRDRPQPAVTRAVNLLLQAERELASIHADSVAEVAQEE